MTASQSSGASESRLPKLAIVAGAGPLPVLLAKAALSEGREVFIIGIEGFAEPGIEAFPHAWNRLGAMGAFIRLLKENRCEEMVLIGAVTRPDLRKLSLDMTAIRLLPKIRSWMKQGDDGLLRGLGGYIQEEAGVRIVGAHEISDGLLAPEGNLTKRAPDESQTSDIAVAIGAVRAIGALDIGQGAVACRGIVLALEAAEGTDAMLDRVASLPARSVVTAKAPWRCRTQPGCLHPAEVAPAPSSSMNSYRASMSSTVTSESAATRSAEVVISRLQFLRTGARALQQREAERAPC